MNIRGAGEARGAMPKIVFVDRFCPADRDRFKRFLRARSYEYIASFVSRATKRPVAVIYQKNGGEFLLPYIATYPDFNIVEHTVVPCNHPVEFLMSDHDDEGVSRKDRLKYIYDKTLHALEAPFERRYAGRSA